MRTKHQNTGACLKCSEIFNKYAGFSIPLRHWFEKLQLEVPESHISCAGRGEQEQEELYRRKVTRAHWGESAHNYNAALDIFEMSGDISDIYEHSWFIKKIRPRIEDWMTWYGDPSAPFWELPHIEVKDWRALAASGVLKLVGEKKNA